MLAGFLAGAAPLGAPMIVAQHMPALFTTSLANLLRNDTGLDVRGGRAPHGRCRRAR